MSAKMLEFAFETSFIKIRVWIMCEIFEWATLAKNYLRTNILHFCLLLGLKNVIFRFTGFLLQYFSWVMIADFVLAQAEPQKRQKYISSNSFCDVMMLPSEVAPIPL